MSFMKSKESSVDLWINIPLNNVLRVLRLFNFSKNDGDYQDNFISVHMWTFKDYEHATWQVWKKSTK